MQNKTPIEPQNELEKMQAAPAETTTTPDSQVKKRWFGRGIYGSKDVPIRVLDTCIVLMAVAAIALTMINSHFGGFSIVFDTGMSDVTVAAQKVRHGEVIAQPEDPARPGYVLLGWSTAVDSTEPWKWSTPVENDMTLYALWQPAAVKVKFDLAGGTLDGADAAPDATAVYGEAYGTLPTPNKQGSVFDGWQYSGQTITAESIVTATGEHVLTAQWR